MYAKLWTRSKTLWFNFLIGLPVLLDILVRMQEGGMVQLLSEEWQTAFNIALVIGNTLLRFRTVRPVALTQKG